MITEDRLTKALTYLAHSDEDCAARKAEVARTEYIAKLHEAIGFKAATGTVDERKADAKVSSQKYWFDHFEAIKNYEQMRAKRELEALVVDVWRSINANRRQGGQVT